MTVHKDGPNKGRQFYGCPKGMNSTCHFFKWADENDFGGNIDRNNSTFNRGGYGGRDGDGNATKRVRATGGKRKCGNCGMEGRKGLFLLKISHLLFILLIYFL